MAAAPPPAPGLFALLIGIDYYRPGSVDGLMYPCLSGCVRDIGHVEEFLRQRLNVADDHMFKLTSTTPPVGKLGPVEPAERQPTYRNMAQAFQMLTERASKGDLVYIHYSGHGGRTPTLWKELKGADGLDESLVPLDISDPKSQYLRDLELGHLLQAMVDRGLVVTLVLDSCHSGGATRGLGLDTTAAVRGVDFIDSTPRPTALVAPAAELAATWQRQNARTTRNVSSETGWVPAPNDYVLLAACRPHELAYEASFEGPEKNGALTYCWLRALRDLRSGSTYRAVYDRILAGVHSRFELQTPLLLGPADRAVFGTDRLPIQPASLVLQVDEAGRRVLLQTGQAVGVRKGAQFALYPQDADRSDPQQRSALVEITDLGASESWAKILKTFGAGKIEAGDPAILLGAARLKRKVRLVEAEEGHLALDAVRQAMTTNGWVEEAAAGGDADFHVSVDPVRRVYVIGDAANLPLANLPPFRTTDTNAGDNVVRLLERLARYRAVEEINNHDEDSPLAGKLVVELLGRQKDYDLADQPNPTKFPDASKPELNAGEWTFVRIRNTSNQTLNVSALDLQPDWGISLVYPRHSDASFEELEPGREKVLKLQAGLPRGYVAGTDILKVFATVGTADFRTLTLPGLDEPGTTRGEQDQLKSRAGKPPSQLDRLLCAVATAQPTRSLSPGAAPSEEWTVTQVSFRVIAAPPPPG